MQAQLLWGLVFGSVGTGYFIYGKRQGSLVPLICGLALIVYPFFVSNAYLLVAIGVLIGAVPFWLRR
ncbi:MAG TPA: hypothetical protein VMV25_12925 [Steroidobacteraceae bacterium]|nr:hypothetical protein [Steroidobacteraceae bacterium]